MSQNPIITYQGQLTPEDVATLHRAAEDSLPILLARPVYVNDPALQRRIDELTRRLDMMVARSVAIWEAVGVKAGTPDTRDLVEVVRALRLRAEGAQDAR